MPADPVRDGEDLAWTPVRRRGVSVVLPAYNAGRYLQRCLDSLVAQTLDRELFDVLAVDDGSTDGTGERLDAFAAAHPGLMRVEHIPNSGWPGRPRNLGTRLSDREYVFYCDADDWLPDGALAAMLEQAEAHRADVLLGRVVGRNRAVTNALFEKGDVVTTWRETPAVFGTLTCQKLFRREFLRDRAVAFGEGRVRLEDFLFMTAAYLRAERISVLGSQPCYVFERREDGGNLTATPASEDEYYDSVERIVRVVLADTEAGPDQDLALDRVIRSEIVNALSRPPFLRKPRAAQVAALARGQRLLRDVVPESAVARLDPALRNRARAIMAGDLEAVLAGIRAEQAVALRVTATGMEWRGDVLHVSLRVDLHRDGVPVRLRREGDRLFLPPRVPGEEPVDVTRAYAISAAHAHVRLREAAAEWRAGFVPQPSADAGDEVPLSWTGELRIAPRTLAGGGPLPFGTWDVRLAFSSSGYSREGRIEAGAGVPRSLPIPAVPSGLPALARLGRGGLVLEVRDPTAPVLSRSARWWSAAREAVARARGEARRQVRRAVRLARRLLGR